MEDEEFNKSIENFKRESEKKPLEKFSWKSFGKKVFDIWISTSIKIVNGLMKFSDKILEIQEKNKEKLEQVKSMQKGKPEPSPYEPNFENVPTINNPTTDSNFTLGQPYETKKQRKKKKKKKLQSQFGEEPTDPFEPTTEWGF